jgi:hypothetical protein
MNAIKPSAKSLSCAKFAVEWNTIVNEDLNSRYLNIEKMIGRDLLFAHGQALHPRPSEEPFPAFAN